MNRLTKRLTDLADEQEDAAEMCEMLAKHWAMRARVEITLTGVEPTADTIAAWEAGRAAVHRRDAQGYRRSAKVVATL